MLQPDDGPQFATAKQVFNTNYNGYTPAVIVTPTSQLDVQKAMARRSVSRDTRWAAGWAPIPGTPACSVTN